MSCHSENKIRLNLAYFGFDEKDNFLYLINYFRLRIFQYVKSYTFPSQICSAIYKSYTSPPRSEVQYIKSTHFPDPKCNI